MSGSEFISLNHSIGNIVAKFAVAALATLLLVSCGKSEVAVCNSPAVLTVIETKNTEKFKKAQVLREALGAISGARSNEAQSLLKSGRNLAGKITNIRQTSYDGANNIRYCAADFEYEQKIFDDYQAVANYLDRTVCQRGFSYKIEAVLDKPDDFYVTWQCVR